MTNVALVAIACGIIIGLGALGACLGPGRNDISSQKAKIYLKFPPDSRFAGEQAENPSENSTASPNIPI